MVQRQIRNSTLHVNYHLPVSPGGRLPGLMMGPPAGTQHNVRYLVYSYIPCEMGKGTIRLPVQEDSGQVIVHCHTRGLPRSPAFFLTPFTYLLREFPPVWPGN